MHPWAPNFQLCPHTSVLVGLPVMSVKEVVGLMDDASGIAGNCLDTQNFTVDA